MHPLIESHCAEGVVVCTSLAEVLQRARAHGSEKLFVLGGAQVYEQALPLADEMILTHLPIKVEGDAYFPAWDEGEWEVVERRCEGELVFATYRRKGYISPVFLKRGTK